MKSKLLSGVVIVVLALFVMKYVMYRPADTQGTPKLFQSSYNGTYESVDGSSTLILRDDKAFCYYFKDDNSYHEYVEGTYYPDDNEVRWKNGRVKSSSYDLVFMIKDIYVNGSPYTSLEISKSGEKIEAQILNFGFATSINEMQSDIDVHDIEHIEGSVCNRTFTKISDNTDVSAYEDMMNIVSEKQSDDGYYWITEDEASDSESTDEESTPAAGGWDL